MCVYPKLKKLLDINNMSLSTLAKRTGIPSSTLYSLKNRNSKRVNIETLKIIADLFGVNVNYFVGGECNTVNFTKEEEELIMKIRGLDTYGKKVVNSVIDIEYERIENLADINVKVNIGAETIEKDVTVDLNELGKIIEELK